MMEEYVDMWVEGGSETILRAADLGFRVCAVVHNHQRWPYGSLKNAGDAGVRVVRKEIHEARTRAEVLNMLRGRPENLIISVIPLTREALMVALRDERVDTVIAHPEIVEVDRHVIQVFENPVELSLRSVKESLGSVKALRNISSLCRVCLAKDLPLLVSSGARTPIELRKPRQLAYLVSALAGINNPHMAAVSTTPARVLERRCLANG